MGDTNPFLNIIKKENLSHAYLCIGDFQQNRNDFEKALENIGISLKKPGHFVFIGDTFKKSDADDLNAWYYRNANNEDGYTIAILAQESLKIDAQELLLKIFEEARNNYIFFLFVQNGTEVIPTIKSRCTIIELNNNTNNSLKNDNEIAKFVKMSVGERIKHVAEQIKNKESHEIRTYTEKLVRDLIEDFYTDSFKENPLNNNLSGHSKDILEKLLKAQNSLADNHIAPKFILDYVVTIL